MGLVLITKKSQNLWFLPHLLTCSYSKQFDKNQKIFQYYTQVVGYFSLKLLFQTGYLSFGETAYFEETSFAIGQFLSELNREASQLQ